MPKYHIAQDDGGFFIADEDHIEAINKSFPTRASALKALKDWQAEMAQARHDANVIDRCNHDDLGESPDY